MGLPSGRLTMLFTDVEGSTRLLSELGTERYAALLAEHHAAVRGALARHGGHEVDTEGDAFFAVFTDADDALAAAADAQDGLARIGVRVRMGVHTGVATLAATGYVGLDVHHAARVGAAAHGGQVVVSASTRALAGDGRALRDLGLHRLKDLTEPQRLFQLGDGEFPPLKTLYGTNLPVQPTPLVGRERELREIAEWVLEAPVVTLVGPGGSGKTRLALHAAAELVDSFPDGVWWVPLQAVRDAELVDAAVGEAIGAKGSVAEHVRGRQLLLVLDNFEQVVDAAPAVSELVEAGARVLVTSREPLRIDRERRYAVDPLAEDDAVALFVERARAVDAAFEPSPAVAAICRRLDSLPLAVELAAARVDVLGLEGLLDRLEHRLPLLTRGRRDAPERQRTLRATIEWSHELLDREQQELFARLSAFASFTLEAAEAVCDADVDGVGMLVEKSLLRRWASGRLGMLETVHEYATERLDAAGAEAVHARHRDHFLDLARRSAPLLEGGEQVRVAETLEAELSNYAALFERALAAGDPEPVLEPIGILMRFWEFRGRVDFARHYVERALALAGPPSPARREALRFASMCAMLSGDLEASLARMRQSLALAESAGDAWATADLRRNVGIVLMLSGEVDEAMGESARALAESKALGDERLIRGALHVLGEVKRLCGDLDAAASAFEESVEISRRLGDTAVVAQTTHSHGDVLLDARSLDAAAGKYVLGARAGLDVGDLRCVALCLGGLAAVSALRGSNDTASTLWAAVQQAVASGDVEIHGHDLDPYRSFVTDLRLPEEPVSLQEALAQAAGAAAAAPAGPSGSGRQDATAER